MSAEGSAGSAGEEALKASYETVKGMTTLEIGKLISTYELTDVRNAVMSVLEELSEIKELDEFKTKCNILLSPPKYLMCLFVCGLIESITMNLGVWDNKKTEDASKFNTFRGKFLKFLKQPNEYTYASTRSIEDVPDAFNNFEAICQNIEIPVDLGIIRDNTMGNEDCVLDIYRQTTDYADYGLEVWPLLFSLSLKLEKQMGCFGVTSATGASYIFLYNLPVFRDVIPSYGTDKAEYWNRYILSPIALYRNTIQTLQVAGKTQIVSNISTPLREDRVFLYVHLFTSLTLPVYQTKSFYSRFKKNDEGSLVNLEFTQNVLCMSGMTYTKIYATAILNPMNLDADHPFHILQTIPEKTKGIGRLADYYLDVMNNICDFREPVPSCVFFPIDTDKKHTDVLMRGNHYVEYDWVFRNKFLLDTNWQTHLPSPSADDWQHISVCRRVYNAMWSNIQVATQAKLKGLAEPFFVQYSKGNRIIKNGETGTVELDLEAAYANTADPKAKLTSKTVTNFQNSQPDEIKTAIRAYFGNNTKTMSDFARKYVVTMDAGGALVVVDSRDMQASGNAAVSVPLNVVVGKKFGILQPAAGAEDVDEEAQGEEEGDDDDSSQSSGKRPSMSARKKHSGPGLTTLIETLGRVTKRHVFDIHSRARKVGDLSALTDAQRRYFEQEHAELEQTKIDLEKITNDLTAKSTEFDAATAEKDRLETELAEEKQKAKEADDKSKAQLESIETLTTDKAELEGQIAQKDTLIEELNEKDSTAQARIEELEKRVAELEELLKKLGEDKGNDEANLRVAIEALQESLDKSQEETKAKAAELDAQKTASDGQIADLEDKNKTLTEENEEKDRAKRSGEAQNTSDVAALTDENEKLKKEVQALTNINKMHEQSDIETTQELRDAKRNEKKLERELATEEATLESAELALQAAIRDMDTSDAEALKEYDAKMSEAMTIVITAEMRLKLKNGEFKEFYDLVSVHPAAKEKYTEAALFPVLESMGGTWRMALLDREVIKAEEDYEETIIEQIVYDLRQWDSIDHAGKASMPYTSKYFKMFMKAFDLKDQSSAHKIDVHKPRTPSVPAGAPVDAHGKKKSFRASRPAVVTRPEPAAATNEPPADDLGEGEA